MALVGINKSNDYCLTKCGELFMINSLNDLELSLKCIQCQDMYYKVEDFRHHLISKHLAVENIPYNETESFTVSYDDDNITEIERIDLHIETEKQENFLDKHNITNESQESLNAKLKNLCNICPKGFKNKYNLETHVFSHCPIKPFKCNFCPRTYANKQNLMVHLRRHKGEKPFDCERCFRSFATSSEKKIHLRSHTGEKPHICQECGKGHATSSQLLEHHRRLHLDERKFTCDLCTKAFQTKKHLQSHQEAVHSKNSNSHVCEICNLPYKTDFYLKAHMKIHRKKTYKCSLCGKEFAQHSGLYQHKKFHIKNSI